MTLVLPSSHTTGRTCVSSGFFKVVYGARKDNLCTGCNNFAHGTMGCSYRCWRPGCWTNATSFCHSGLYASLTFPQPPVSSTSARSNDPLALLQLVTAQLPSYPPVYLLDFPPHGGVSEIVKPALCVFSQVGYEFAQARCPVALGNLFYPLLQPCFALGA